MAGIPSNYFRVCDTCGELVSIAASDPGVFLCPVCTSTAAWEFPLWAKARDMQQQIRDRIAS